MKPSETEEREHLADVQGIDTTHRNIKHLLIDEMQDYTPVQYAVIARLFTCNKTILGDANQSVNPYSSSKAEDIQQVFKQASCVKLYKSYRSTYEITQFAQRISPNPDLIAIERHGDAPLILPCKNTLDERGHIGRLVREFLRGVIVCTAHMAKGLEFDQVIVPDVSDRNYNTSMDRNLLYVACTRAMHKLALTFSGELTRFLQPGTPV